MPAIETDSATIGMDSSFASPSAPAFAHLAIKAAIVFVVSFVALALSTTPMLIQYDEGLILTGAMRVAAGAVPHRDFYANYGPGQFYVIAGLFDLFGQSALVERLYDTFVKAGVVCCVYAISSRIMRPLHAIAATAFSLLWIAAAQYPGYPVWPSLLAILASIWLALPIFFGVYSFWRLVGAGLCVGAVTLFRYDMGLLSLALVTIALIVFAATNGPSSKPLLNRLAFIIAPFWGAAGLALAGLAVAYLWNNVFGDFEFQMIAYPSQHYAEMRALPFPRSPHEGLLKFIVYLPPLAVVSFIVFMTVEYLEAMASNLNKPAVWIATLIALFAAGLYLKGIVRVSVIHMISSIIPSFIVLGFAADRLLALRRPVSRSALGLPVVAALLLAVVTSLDGARYGGRNVLDNLPQAVALARSLLQGSHAAIGDARCNPDPALSRARCFIVSPAEAETVRYVLAHSAPDQTILVADGVNDKTSANDNTVYFLTGRQPATKWNQFDPGLQSSEKVQAEMVADLERSKPPLVILDTQWDDSDEPNGSSKHSGVTLLDDYIRQYYKEAARFDPYKIMQR